MIIFYKPESETSVIPIVLLDYTRSDDLFSQAEIENEIVASFYTNENLGKKLNRLQLEIFSLNYAVTYSHFGNNPAESLKTSCTIEINNAPSSMTNLLNVKQFTSQESSLSLESATKSIIDPKVQFPTASIVIKPPLANFNDDKIIRKIIIYKTNFGYDSRRIVNKFLIYGSTFSSRVIGLDFSANITTKEPLSFQVKKLTDRAKYSLNFDLSVALDRPIVERYYPPSTLNSILSAIGKDFGLFVSINDEKKSVEVNALNPKNPPQKLSFKKFCFRGLVPDAKVISNFSVEDYAKVIVESEVEDLDIFDYILIFDDSGSELLFENFIEFNLPFQKIKSYRFYLLDYTITYDKTYTKLRFSATNNWIVSNFKLGNFLENAIYKGQF